MVVSVETLSGMRAVTVLLLSVLTSVHGGMTGMSSGTDQQSQIRAFQVMEHETLTCKEKGTSINHPSCMHDEVSLAQRRLKLHRREEKTCADFQGPLPFPGLRTQCDVDLKKIIAKHEEFAIQLHLFNEQAKQQAAHDLVNDPEVSQMFVGAQEIEKVNQYISTQLRHVYCRGKPVADFVHRLMNILIPELQPRLTLYLKTFKWAYVQKISPYMKEHTDGDWTAFAQKAMAPLQQLVYYADVGFKELAMQTNSEGTDDLASCQEGNEFVQNALVDMKRLQDEVDADTLNSACAQDAMIMHYGTERNWKRNCGDSIRARCANTQENELSPVLKDRFCEGKRYDQWRREQSEAQIKETAWRMLHDDDDEDDTVIRMTFQNPKSSEVGIEFRSEGVASVLPESQADAQGVEVASVLPGSQADAQGLEVGWKLDSAEGIPCDFDPSVCLEAYEAAVTGSQEFRVTFIP